MSGDARQECAAIVLKSAATVNQKPNGILKGRSHSGDQPEQSEVCPVSLNRAEPVSIWQ